MMSHDGGVFRRHHAPVAIVTGAKSNLAPPSAPKSEEEGLKPEETRLGVAEDLEVTDPTPRLSVNKHLSQLNSTNVMGGRVVRGASSTHLATDVWRGEYDFDFTIYHEDMSKNKNVIYSRSLNKLFVDVNKMFHVRYYVKAREALSEFNVRAVMVYSDPASYVEPVLRCPHHQSQEGEEHTHKSSHVLWAQGSEAYYDEDPTSQRHFVIVPLDEPHVGTSYASYFYKFTCLGSCVGGINRRSTLVVLTLEKNGQVVGRQKFYVRICSCPLRDCKQEETKAQQSTSWNAPKKRKRKIGPTDSSESSNHSGSPAPAASPQPGTPSEPLRRPAARDDIYYVPVFGHENFKALNKFAQFLDSQSGKMANPEYVELREKILRTYNQDKLKATECNGPLGKHHDLEEEESGTLTIDEGS